MPRELERACESFKSYYLASHSGRKLSWQTNMGHAGGRSIHVCQSSHLWEHIGPCELEQEKQEHHHSCHMPFLTIVEIWTYCAM